MKHKWLLACIFFVFGQITHAEVTKQLMAVGRTTPAKAAMDLIQACLSNPLIEAKVVTFAGIENLEFSTATENQMTKTYASGQCLFKSESK